MRIIQGKSLVLIFILSFIFYIFNRLVLNLNFKFHTFRPILVNYNELYILIIMNLLYTIYYIQSYTKKNAAQNDSSDELNLKQTRNIIHLKIRKIICI